MAVFSALFCIAIATGRTDTRNEAIIWGCTYSLWPKNIVWTSFSAGGFEGRWVCWFLAKGVWRVVIVTNNSRRVYAEHHRGALRGCWLELSRCIPDGPTCSWGLSTSSTSKRPRTPHRFSWYPTTVARSIPSLGCSRERSLCSTAARCSLQAWWWKIAGVWDFLLCRPTGKFTNALWDHWGPYSELTRL